MEVRTCSRSGYDVGITVSLVALIVDTTLSAPSPCSSRHPMALAMEHSCTAGSHSSRCTRVWRWWCSGGADTFGLPSDEKQEMRI